MSFSQSNLDFVAHRFLLTYPPKDSQFLCYGWMNEWMNGWMNEWMNGWMNEWMDGWMDELMDELIH